MENQALVPMKSTAEQADWYNQFVQMTKNIFKKDLDYGEIPGVNKPSLYKAGAEKLRLFYNIATEMECVHRHEDWETGLFDYTYKCTAKAPDGRIIAECEGGCNSFEPKFRYKWRERAKFDINEEQERLNNGTARIKKYGSKRVLLERIEHPDPAEKKNTVMKIAQKRAFVGVILMATGASEFFTQDVEDLDYITVDPNERITALTDEIIKEVADAKSSDAVKDVWAKYTGLHRNDEFKDLIANRAKEVENDN